MSAWQLSLLLMEMLSCLLIPECSASTDPRTVSAFAEEDVALSCFNSTLTDPTSCYRMRWTKVNNNDSMTIFEWPPKSPHPRNVRWGLDSKGVSCLFLRDLKQSDGGSYNYKVWKGWDVALDKNISLRIRECKVLQAMRASPGSPAELKCSHDVTQGPSNVTWAMLKGRRHATISPTQGEKRNTSLVFLSVTPADSGWYRCTLKSEKSQRCYDVNLLVQEKFFEATSIQLTITTTLQDIQTTEHLQNDEKSVDLGTLGSVVPYVVSGIIVMVVIAGLIALLLHCKRKKKLQFLNYPVQTDIYENVSLAGTLGNGKRDNSLYHVPEETVSTFKY